MSQQPVPVEPLSYAPMSHDSWLPILKAAAVASMVMGTAYCVYMLCQCGMAVLGNIGFATFSNLIGIALEVTKGLAGVAMTIFGFQCLRVSPIARRSLIFATAAAAILSVVSGAWTFIFIYNAMMRSTIPAMQLTIQTALVLTSTATNLILPILLIWILTRNQMKEIFLSRAVAMKQEVCRGHLARAECASRTGKMPVSQATNRH